MRINPPVESGQYAIAWVRVDPTKPSKAPRVRSDVELYDPITDRVTVNEGLPDPRYRHTATVMNDGTVLIAGGAAIEKREIRSGVEVIGQRYVDVPPGSAVLFIPSSRG